VEALTRQQQEHRLEERLEQQAQHLDQRGQLFLLSQQNEEFILQHEEFSQQNEEVMSQNQGQWELLASIESAVVPACVDVVVEYATEGGASPEEKY
jgi:hypothetical protein